MRHIPDALLCFQQCKLPGQDALNSSRWLQVTVYVSCYVEAQNRDAFMAVKQDLLLAFVDCVERNRAELARVRLSVGTLTMFAC